MQPGPHQEATAVARFGSRSGCGTVECIDLRTQSDRLDAGGLWFVVADFEDPEQGGRARAWRFTGDDATADQGGPEGWVGPASSSWTGSMDQGAYEDAVRTVRAAVQEGEVYQANVCRVMEAPLPAGGHDGASEPDAAALARVLAAGNPAPHEGFLHVPAVSGVDPVWVVTASPELFVRVREGRITSSPIKGTAVRADGLSAKDRAENVMITDLVRNDLQRVCAPGTVEVETLLGVEEHPGLVHLVSTVTGTLAEHVAGPAGVDWTAVLAATFPPASVTGAPKSSALRIIADLEPVPRGPYCGAVGWIDADAGEAELAVGIRTFWWADGILRFGTGAGITWGSDPVAEWEETELKARRLVGLASHEELELDG